MKHLLRAVVILVSAAACTGCSRSCFRKAGMSIEQCKRDLLQCIDQARVQPESQRAQRTCSCMQAKGYECLDANKLSPGTKRITVMASFGTYWVVDGLEAAPAGQRSAAQQEQHEGVVEPSQAKPVGYRARLDETGKHTFVPVYEHEQAGETSSARLASPGN